MPKKSLVLCFESWISLAHNSYLALYSEKLLALEEVKCICAININFENDTDHQLIATISFSMSIVFYKFTF